MMPSLLIVDANHTLHRVMKQPSVAELKMGGVFGFLRTLHQVLGRYPFRQVVACWDSGLSPRRRALCPEYKQHRDPPEPGYRERFNLNRAYLSQLFALLGVGELRFERREADDIIHRLRERVRLLDPTVAAVVISEDRDFFQLVDEVTVLYLPRKDRYVTLNCFEELAGVPRDRFLLCKSILGDRGDNISGIPGVGEVTAKKIANSAPVATGALLEEQWEPVRLYCADSTDKRVRKASTAWHIVYRNYQLVALDLEPFTPMELADMDALITQPPEVNLEGARSLLSAMEFRSIIATFGDWAEPFKRLRSGPCVGHS